MRSTSTRAHKNTYIYIMHTLFYANAGKNAIVAIRHRRSINR